jgi:FkbM family methyltransferase
MIRSLVSNIARFVANKRSNNFTDSFYKNLNLFLKKCNNVNFDPDNNGELRLLTKFRKLNFKIIFDVGANNGGWVNMCKSIYGSSFIHAFEIVPNTFKELHTNCKDVKNLQLNSIGLSDFSGEVDIFLGAASVGSTAFKIEGMKDHDSYYKERIKCNVITGEDYMISHEIPFIDFLKIDTEGNDLRVIKGFKDRLIDVKIIQFEYGIFNIASKDLLIDFFNHLERYGFMVGKIFPSHIDFTSYYFEMENFHGGNFIAINKRYPDILKILHT